MLSRSTLNILLAKSEILHGYHYKTLKVYPKSSSWLLAVLSPAVLGAVGPLPYFAIRLRIGVIGGVSEKPMIVRTEAHHRCLQQGLLKLGDVAVIAIVDGSPAEAAFVIGLAVAALAVEASAVGRVALHPVRAVKGSR